MEYHITHHTHYRYSRPVQLGPQTLRLTPRNDGAQQLQDFSLQVTPEPQQRWDSLDAEGNGVIQLRFQAQPVESLTLESHCQVKASRSNPFDYLAEPWALQLPFDYPAPCGDRSSPIFAMAMAAALPPPPA